jgi:hypothetical protein
MFLIHLLTLKSIPMFLLTFVMYLLTLKSIPMFLMTFVYFCDVSDSSIDFEHFNDLRLGFGLFY